MKPKIEKKVVGYLVHFDNMNIDCYFDDYKKADAYFENQKKEFKNIMLQSLELVSTTSVDARVKPVKTYTSLTLMRVIQKVN